MANLTVIDFNKKISPVNDEVIEIISQLYEMAKNGEITEFASTVVLKSGSTEIYTVASDIVSGVGLYEVGKSLFIAEHLI